MTEVIEGQDIWLNEDEVIARWARKKGNSEVSIPDYKTKTEKDERPRRTYVKRSKGE